MRTVETGRVVSKVMNSYTATRRVRDITATVAYGALDNMGVYTTNSKIYIDSMDVTNDAAYNDTYESTRSAVREGLHEAVFAHE
jgi:hypothetical protein